MIRGRDINTVLNRLVLLEICHLVYNYISNANSLIQSE